MKVDYVALSIPVFFLLIGIELAYSFYKKLSYYRLNDSITNLSLGIGSQIVGLFLKAATFYGYLYIFQNWRFYTFPNTIWTWLLLFIGVDFFYYWFHRMSHEVNALWAAHIVHHQSEEYNLTVALRQSWFQSGFSWVFYLPLAFVGFDPIMFLTVSSVNLLYQFWIHTRAIGKLGPLEWILNTPSHHRVHHGSNPKYIDKNHAGSLIIWDRMFGTFQQEEEEVVYGITKPLASWNPVWANFHYWAELFGTARSSRNLADGVRVFLKPPGWFPEHLGGFQHPSEIDIAKYQKYSPDFSNRIIAYMVVQFLIGLITAVAVLFLNEHLSSVQLIYLTFLIIMSIMTCGALLEQKSWLRKFELVRLIVWFAAPFFFIESHYFTSILIPSSALSILCLFWFLRIKTTLYV